MDLATLCDTWRWKYHQWCHLAVLSEDVAFAHHFVAPTLPPCRSASDIDCTYLKWEAIQLAIHLIVGA